MFQRMIVGAVAVVVASISVAVAAEAISVELKDFKLPADGVVLDEGNSKIAFYAAGEAVATVKVVEDGEYTITVEASGDEAEKMKAKMTIKVGDDVVKENFELAMNESKEYTFVAKMKKGDAKLSIAFTNDAYKENEFDRNLYVHKVKLELKK